MSYSQMYLDTDSTSSKVLDGHSIWWDSLWTTWLNAKLSLNIEHFHNFYTELSLTGNTVCFPLVSCIKCIINLYINSFTVSFLYKFQLFFFSRIVLLQYCRCPLWNRLILLGAQALKHIYNSLGYSYFEE